MIVFIRPYYLVFIAISLFFSRLIKFKNFLKLKIDKKTFFLIIIGSVLIIPFYKLFGEVISIDDNKTLNLQLLSERASNFKDIAVYRGKYVDEEGLSKIILVLFGPFSIKSLNFIAESLAGLVTFFLFIRIVYLIPIKKFIILNPILIFFVSMICLELIKYQYSVFNLGIIVRQRIYLIIYLSLFLSYLITKININKMEFKK